MKKAVAGVLVVVAVVLGSLFAAPAAMAYPDGPSVNPPTVKSNGAPSPSSSILPSTGGPSMILFAGALVLLVAGSTAVVVSRRRQAD